MPEPGNPSPSSPTAPSPCLPLDYVERPRRTHTRFGLTVFCLSVFSLAFMATSFAMYKNILHFNHRPIQLWIAWASIALGGVSALLSPIALFLRRGIYEICAMIGAFLYWLVFILLLHA